GPTAPDALRSRVPDPPSHRLGQETVGNRQYARTLAQDRERLSHAAAGKDAPHQQRRTDALCDQERAGGLSLGFSRESTALSNFRLRHLILAPLLGQV